MKAKIINSKRLKENDYGRTRVIDILNTKGYPKVSIARVKRVSAAPPGYNPISDVMNYVLKGRGKMTIGNKQYTVKEDDLIFIPKGTRYSTPQRSTLLVVSSPRFQRDKQVYPKR